MLALPPYIFIMSDHESRQLACDVAELLSRENNMVLVDDFLAPIYEGLGSMFELDWKRDLGVPINSNRLLLPALKESTEGDMIKDLERWFIERFGPFALGQMALARAAENREVADYSVVFRDATPEHLKAFWETPSLVQKRQMFVLHLGGGTSLGAPAQDLFVALKCTPEEIVTRIGGVL